MLEDGKLFPSRQFVRSEADIRQQLLILPGKPSIYGRRKFLIAAIAKHQTNVCHWYGQLSVSAR